MIGVEPVSQSLERPGGKRRIPESKKSQQVQRVMQGSKRM